MVKHSYHHGSEQVVSAEREVLFPFRIQVPVDNCTSVLEGWALELDIRVTGSWWWESKRIEWNRGNSVLGMGEMMMIVAGVNGRGGYVGRRDLTPPAISRKVLCGRLHPH